MKFTYGQWVPKKGTSIFSAKQLFDYAIDDGMLKLWVMPYPGRHRAPTGDNGAMLTYRFTSPADDVIHAELWHHDGVPDPGPRFELHSNEKQPVAFTDDDKIITMRSGRLTMQVNKESFAIAYYFDGKFLTKTAGFSAYIKTAEYSVYMREQLSLGVGECVYGMGERFTPFVKNGQVVDCWNEDGGTSSEIAYKNIPFYLTNKNYGVFVNHPELVSFETASEQVERVQFSVPGERLNYFIMAGNSMKEVLMRYTDLTGKPPLPPAWSFGLWLSTSFTTDYSEETVNSFVDGMSERKIPMAVFHFDCFWMKGYQWTDFEWDSKFFPDPAGMLKRLKQKGLKICVWINPYIAQKSKLFDEGKKNGYLLKRHDGGVWQTDMWQPGMGIVDFTNPEACKWFQSYLKELTDMGVDSIKTDFGERIPTDVVYYDGSDPVKMHNYYTHLYNKTVYDLLAQELGAAEAVVFARSATAGGQQFPVHWGGDSWATFESMAESLRGGLSLCLSGFGYWSHDMGGFESTATSAVYKRWFAFGMLSSHSRLHGSQAYKVPWLYDEESVNVASFFSRLKNRLMPYIYKEARETSLTGVPMMRAMVMEFGDDPACKYLDTQYLFGSSLLVAPVFNETNEVTFYVPGGGVWTDLLSGKEYGAGFMTESFDFFSLPLLVRPNTILPVGVVDDMSDYEYADGADLRVYALADGKCTETEIISVSGETTLTCAAKRNGNVLTFEYEGNGKPFYLTLVNVFVWKASEGGEEVECEIGKKLKLDGKAGIVTVTV